MQTSYQALNFAEYRLHVKIPIFDTRKEKRMRLIDANKLRKAVESLPNCYNGFSDTYDKACIIGVIDEQPTIEPVKRGKWIYDNQFHWYRASCSECGYKRVTDIKAEKWNDWSYCPNCGAKMEAAPTIIEAEEVDA